MLLIVGETLVAFMRQIATLRRSGLSPLPGPWPSGAPAIAAYSASMLGAPTHLVAGIGRDGAGDTIRSRLCAAGVTCHESGGGHLRPTATAYITDYAGGHREFESGSGTPRLPPWWRRIWPGCRSQRHGCTFPGPRCCSVNRWPPRR